MKRTGLKSTKKYIQINYKWSQIIARYYLSSLEHLQIASRHSVHHYYPFSSFTPPLLCQKWPSAELIKKLYNFSHNPKRPKKANESHKVRLKDQIKLPFLSLSLSFSQTTPTPFILNQTHLQSHLIPFINVIHLSVSLPLFLHFSYSFFFSLSLSLSLSSSSYTISIYRSLFTYSMLTCSLFTCLLVTCPLLTCPLLTCSRVNSKWKLLKQFLL